MRALKSFALLRESTPGMVGALLVLFWVIIAILAPLIAPFDPLATLQPMAKPGTVYAQGGTFWLGTDHLGRDILSRIIFGSQTVLFYAPLATLCAYTLGILMGLAAGYHLGWWDILLSRISDIILSFPVLVLYIIIIATIGSSGINIIIAITFASAPGIMRIVRGLVLDLRNRDYVAAAQTRGESPMYIMLVEILPNARGPLIVDACLRLGYVIITIGVLGFLGLGLPPPDPDWGGMINETRKMAMIFPHMTIFPCIAISSLILGFNLLADGLREVSLRD
ncbi:MAG: ABC transporter permease [Rhodospirillaceae bacterium]|nr:ABC transporter permease [Rhodospirillaceae bacterium]MBT5242753.1 ABC transporter permease [Rhodospirillaceae bacterium]MBT5561566.1 ABC transporter permease [Rhodospirillaceae bacterium]MBT6241836.1 ABC transporter permease [Rhodospirillaceae bacterium]MBT7138637.1 ABC transporter permease [Rhodospirillaceae bacterium]